MMRIFIFHSYGLLAFCIRKVRGFTNGRGGFFLPNYHKLDQLLCEKITLLYFKFRNIFFPIAIYIFY